MWTGPHVPWQRSIEGNFKSSSGSFAASAPGLLSPCCYYYDYYSQAYSLYLFVDKKEPINAPFLHPHSGHFRRWLYYCTLGSSNKTL